MEPEQKPTPTQVSPVTQTLATNPELLCKKCHVEILGDFYFCPNCGVKIKEPPFKFSITNLIGNLLITILLPPLGIFPGIKHMKYPDNNARILGAIYIVLTLITSIVILKFTLDFVNSINKSLGNSYYLQNNMLGL